MHTSLKKKSWLGKNIFISFFSFKFILTRGIGLERNDEHITAKITKITTLKDNILDNEIFADGDILLQF